MGGGGGGYCYDHSSPECSGGLTIVNMCSIEGRISVK